jgi:hypothetical protein
VCNGTFRLDTSNEMFFSWRFFAKAVKVFCSVGFPSMCECECDANLTHIVNVNCYVSSSSKLSILRVDDLIKLCSDFYKKDEIVDARCIIDK